MAKKKIKHKAKTPDIPLKPYPIATFDNIIHQPIHDLFGIVSDTHFGSKYAALRELEKMYDYLDERGVKQVFHPGDLTDGTGLYPGQYSELHKIGYEEQAQWTMERYPQKANMTTYIIMGNHDAIYMKKQGADIVKYVCTAVDPKTSQIRRPDLKYAGIFYARFVDDGLSLDIVHPSGSTPYSISYGMQVYLRNQPPSHYPNILVFGHRHRSWYGYYQEVHGLEAGCFMHPNDYLIRKGCMGDIGAWIVEMQRDNGKIRRFKPEWVSLG